MIKIIAEMNIVIASCKSIACIDRVQIPMAIQWWVF